MKKHAMRKWLCLLAALMMALPLTLGAAAAEDAVWETSSTGNVLKKYNGGGGDITIPATLNGNSIIRMETGSIYKDREITSVVFEEGITSIGTNCLYKLDTMETITFPQSLQVIEGYNLYDADILKEVTIPAAVRTIEGGFLGYCEQLEKVVFEGPCPLFQDPSSTLSRFPENAVVLVPDDQLEAYQEALLNVPMAQIQPSGKPAGAQPLSAQYDFDAATGTITNCVTNDAWAEIPAEIGGVPVRAIGPSAFAACTYLTGVVIPDGVESIGDKAFENLKLVYAEVPESVTKIGARAFYYYRGNSIPIPSGLETIADGCYRGANLNGRLAIPPKVRTIGKEAFRGTYVTEVFFPASLELIDSQAFYGNYLTRVSFETAALPEIAEDAFENHYKAMTVELPATATDAELRTAQEKFLGMGIHATVVRKPAVELQAEITDEALRELQSQLSALGVSATVVRAAGSSAAPAPAPEPTAAPASEPTAAPAPEPTAAPAPEPTAVPTAEPTAAPTAEPAPAPAPQQGASSGGSWTKYKGVYYYEDAAGKRITGWVQDSGNWYYLDPQYNGAMKTGWLQLNNNWYYLNPDGARATGWVQVKGMWYYLDENGVMQTGWIRDLEAEAKLDPPGSREIWHWCNSQGVMMADGFKQIDGRWEYFDKNGVWQPDVRP